MTVADPIACAPIRLAARPPVRSQLGRLAQVDMFQLALRLRGIEVEQDADAARQPVGHGDFRGAEQRHVAPPEESRRAGRVLGREVRRRRENGALHVLGLKAVRLEQRAQQLRRRLEDRLARVRARRGGAPQAPQDLGHGPGRSVALMVLTDAGLLKGRDPVEACRRAVAGGATIVQVRHKGAPAREVAALARALVGALPVPVLVNDRVDVALAAGAAGAHLGQDDPPLDAVRPYVPPGFLLGASVGSPAEADRVRPWPADYWSVGPCYATDNKPDAGSPLGPAGFARLARLAPAGVPVIGIGGITPAVAAPSPPPGGGGGRACGARWGASGPGRAARARPAPAP